MVTILLKFALILYFNNNGNIKINLKTYSMETKQALSALAAIAQDSRLAIFRLLVKLGPSGMNASGISEELNISPSSLSFHLKELSHADLVKVKQEGRYMIYAANFDTMNGLLAFLTDSCCGGNPCTPVSQCKSTGIVKAEPLL